MVPAMRAVYEAEETAGRAPVFAAACERAILARLRSMTPAEFDALDTGHEGVGQRLYNASRNAATLDAVLDLSLIHIWAADPLQNLLYRRSAHHPHGESRPQGAGAAEAPRRGRYERRPDL